MFLQVASGDVPRKGDRPLENEVTEVFYSKLVLQCYMTVKAYTDISFSVLQISSSLLFIKRIHKTDYTLQNTKSQADMLL